MSSKDIYILGISAYYHDSAVAIIKNGKIIAAAQEERFSRKKHDAVFPSQALNYCLKEAGIGLHQVSDAVFYDKPFLKFERLLETYLAHAPFGFTSFIKSMPIWLKEKLYLKKVLRDELGCYLDDKSLLPSLKFSQHHQSHAASAFFPSPFKNAAVLCLDGVGEWVTTSIWKGNENSLTPLLDINFPHSIGLLYSAFTYYCGFKVNSGEYKLMGLAPYGNAIYKELILEKLIDLKEDGSFKLNMQYFDYCVGLRMTNSKFSDLFGHPPRLPESDLTQHYMDMAASVQAVTEEVVLKLAIHAHKVTGSKNLCMAGGVALNCVANGLLLRDGPFENVWVQPAAGDAGGALGSALALWYQYYEKERINPPYAHQDDAMFGSYLGPSFSDSDIKGALDGFEASYNFVDDDILFDSVANLLASGSVVGWFQGRMEFGPRALGARSILGDPRIPDMQKIMNLKIKNRESFRPFAPSVLEEDVNKYFKMKGKSPYMLMVSDVSDEVRIPYSFDAKEKDIFSSLHTPRSLIPAVTHVDYSARVQTVNSTSNERYYKLLSSFKQLTGCSVLINTSFNVRGEPIVNTPEHAYKCFMTTEMDVLVLGNFIIHKSDQNVDLIEELKSEKVNNLEMD